MKLITVKFAPLSLYLIYHRLIYLPQNSLSSVFLGYLISATLTNRVSHPYKQRKYTSVYLNIYIFLRKTVRQMFMVRSVAIMF